MSVETDKKNLRLIVSHNMAISMPLVKMLALCSLMQLFIMAMLKLHSIIEFFAAVEPQVHEGKRVQSDDSHTILQSH